MVTAIIGVLFFFGLCGVAYRANARVQSEYRSPMQWLLPDEVIWSAPRRIALAFVPALALVSFAGLAVLSLYARPRPSQEGMLIPSMIAIGLVFLAIQIFHLRMIERTIYRDRH
jgi:hypothetical protein